MKTVSEYSMNSGSHTQAASKPKKIYIGTKLLFYSAFWTAHRGKMYVLVLYE